MSCGAGTLSHVKGVGPVTKRHCLKAGGAFAHTSQHCSWLVTPGLHPVCGGKSGFVTSVHTQQPNCCKAPHWQVERSKPCPSGQVVDKHCPPHSMVPAGHAASHRQVERLKACPSEQVVNTHAPPQSVVPLGHWHAPSTHSLPSGQRLEQLPQCRSLLCRLTQLPLQQVRFDEPQRLRQRPQCRSLLCRLTHLSPQRVYPSEHRSSAHATPGTETKAAPTRTPPIHLSALPLETAPVASP
jgi:hypothetical protein